ncbi:glycosyltransferase family 4 protein [Agromyces aurantiacus]|uniref:Glycosyltransferase family 4 protein n=1 Tax=Agromyces aurantiacus TaxID=165814 RepID=A0ABV9R6X0_9MICO|nr:glycosyltransferase family 4 protein [Agromyces aurantiacus]MBM7502735.1 glycosyltransferase involved in cell wall biosynthesis [Agromyces aurantiacus]
MTTVIHAITPGDHFSPRTGSAIPTVVHGLASAAARDVPPWPQAVVVDRSTMRPRYDSAEPIEYDSAPWLTRNERGLDLVRARLGGVRRGTARFFTPVADAIRAREPSIVLAHNAPVLPWLLRDSPHQVILYAHNDLLRTYTRAEAGRALAGVAAIVCVSDSLADRTRAALPPALADQVHVVPNGVDAVQFSPAGDDAPPRPPGKPLRIMFVGRMIAEKGPDVLVEAAARLQRPDLEFVIVGSRGFARDAPLSAFERELRRTAQDSGADIRFEPFVDRMSLPDLLRSADALVVPSRWAEPSGLTASEGLATGLPVIASRIGGLPDVVGDAGILVAPDDPATLADAIAALADDPAERARRAAASRAYALAHDWSWSWARLRRVLEEL